MKLTERMLRKMIKEESEKMKFSVGDEVEVMIFGEKRKGKITSMMDDMATVDFGKGDKYGITLRRMKKVVKESIEMGDGGKLNWGFDDTIENTGVKIEVGKYYLLRQDYAGGYELVAGPFNEISGAGRSKIQDYDRHMRPQLIIVRGIHDRNVELVDSDRFGGQIIKRSRIY